MKTAKIQKPKDGPITTEELMEFQRTVKELNKDQKVRLLKKQAEPGPISFDEPYEETVYLTPFYLGQMVADTLRFLNVSYLTYRKSHDGDMDMRSDKFTKAYLYGLEKLELGAELPDEYVRANKGPQRVLPDKAVLFSYGVMTNPQNREELGEEEDRYRLTYYLTNGYNATYDCSPDIVSEIIRPFNNAYWFASKEGVSYFKWPNAENEGIFRSVIRTNVKRDYFVLFIKAIYQSYTGISPVIAQELCCRAHIESDQSARELSEEEQLHLCRIFLELMEDVKEGNFSPNIIYDAQDTPVEYASVPLSMYADLNPKKYDSVSEVLETYYARKNDVTRIRQKSADLRHLVNTMLEREAKKLDLQSRQLKDTEKRDKFRLYGELLHTWSYEIEPGAASALLPNYYDNDKKVKITLDPNKSASENAQRYYEKYEKLKRTYDALSELIHQTKADVDQLESVKTFLEQAQSEADLNQIREELAESGYIRKHETQKKKGASRPEKSRPWHYQTEDGYDIYVGKNNLQNDELTFRFANASDWWFHSKKAPGSHVIARRKDGQELPDHIFELAAGAAAYYSSARDADKVEIDYCRQGRDRLCTAPRGEEAKWLQARICRVLHELFDDGAPGHLKAVTCPLNIFKNANGIVYGFPYTIPLHPQLLLRFTLPRY